MSKTGYTNESLEYGQFIDSYPSAEVHLESLNAEIITAASQKLVDSYCSKYMHINIPNISILVLQKKKQLIYIIHFRQDIGSSQACAKQLTKLKLINTSMGEKCLSIYNNQTACAAKNLKYRSIDGSCNNLKRSFLGKANTAYKRLLFPDYENGNIAFLFL